MGRSIPKWHVPQFMFDLVRLTSKRFKYKLDKLFEDECYESKNLEELGFKANKTLLEMNETSF